jgi:hypothetical protein
MTNQVALYWLIESLDAIAASAVWIVLMGVRREAKRQRQNWRKIPPLLAKISFIHITQK